MREETRPRACLTQIGSLRSGPGGAEGLRCAARHALRPSPSHDLLATTRNFPAQRLNPGQADYSLAEPPATRSYLREAGTTASVAGNTGRSCTGSPWWGH